MWLGARFKKRFPELDWDFIGLTHSADAEGGDDAAGGGAGGDEPLGESGKRALDAERRRANDAEKELAKLRRQADAFKGLNPEAFREAQQKVEAAEQRIQELETLIAARVRETEDAYAPQLKAANERAEAAEQRERETTIVNSAREIFYALGGKRENDEFGRSAFDVFLAATRSNFQLDPKTREFTVVDAKGNPVINDKGRVSPVEWVDEQSEKSPVLGLLFDPKSKASGSGMGSDRGPGGRRSVDIHSLSQSELGELAFPGT
jgi:hypothetical protein